MEDTNRATSIRGNTNVKIQLATYKSENTHMEIQIEKIQIG